MTEACYLDWAASAPLCEESADAMAPYMAAGIASPDFSANANSLHSPGRKAFAALEQARAAIAESLNAQRPSEIILCSGATEANNAAIAGIAQACRKRAIQQGRRDFTPHIVSSAIEHDSVLAAARRLKALGFELSLIHPDKNGFISEEAFRAALRENTVLASIQLANNEIGSIQDIAALARVAHEAGILFHTDAVQALGKIPLDLSALGVDAASFSAHKLSGPKGCGALYLKAKIPFESLLVGGGQEEGRRSGTQNVCGAVGFAAALKAALVRQTQELPRLTKMRDGLYAALTALEKLHPSVLVEPGSSYFLPHIANVCVEGQESETLILRLDKAGFAVSGGSACSSHSLEPSHVLRAIGLPEKLAFGSLRLSFGFATSENDIESFLKAFRAVLKGL